MLELRLQVRVTGAVDDEGNVQDQEMSPEVLLRSALLNEVNAWLEKVSSDHRARLTSSLTLCCIA